MASPPAIGSHAEYMPPPLLRLVLMLGIYCFPSYDWFSRWVYTASPLTIGSHAGYILPPLLRLVLTLGIGTTAASVSAAGKSASSTPWCANLLTMQTALILGCKSSFGFHMDT
eukprot:4699122-Pyramimonas_sp.AAC.1